MKKLLTALLLFLAIAQWNTASAQLSQMRLFSPVRSDQFGGDAHLREGVFGEVTYNWWIITKGSNRTIGWIDPAGQQNMYFNGSAVLPRINTISTNALDTSFTGGTTFRIGRMDKHHGWEIKGTFMEPQRDIYQGINGSMDIDDDPLSTNIYVTPMQGFQCWQFNNDPTSWFTEVPTPLNKTPYIQSGYLWGWFPVGATTTGFLEILGPDANDLTAYALAPLPITFDRYKLDSKVSHWDLEANYIFRTHAALGGFFEFTGGARYMELDDRLNFTGWGLPWRGPVLIELMDPTPAYGGGGGGTGTGTTVDVTEFYLQQSVLPDTNRSFTYTGNINGPGTVLADSIWDFKADNHMVGPQVGIRYIRKFNGRWSIIADTKYFAGFNAQSLKSEGIMGSRTVGYDPDTLTHITIGNEDIISGSGTIPWVPVGTMQNPGMFRNHETRNVFSSVIDFSVKANWRLSDAIAFNVGYQGMYLDKTARASLVNSYQIDSLGNIFGINKNVNQPTWIHGVTAEVSLNRY